MFAKDLYKVINSIGEQSVLLSVGLTSNKDWALKCMFANIFCK